MQNEEEKLTDEEILIAQEESSEINEERTETAHDLKAYLLFFTKKDFPDFIEALNRAAMITFGKKENELEREQITPLLTKLLNEYVEKIYNR